MKNEYDNFEKEILVNDVTIEELNKLEMIGILFMEVTLRDHRNKRTTYFYTTLSLSKEYSELYEMIIVKIIILVKMKK